MVSGNKTIEAIREALALTPDNIPLRAHLAELLVEERDLQQAEREYRDVLARSPADKTIMLGLAYVFYLQRKNSAALVILDDLTVRDDAPPRSFYLLCMISIRQNDQRQARWAYREAINRDATLFDPEIEKQLFGSDSNGLDLIGQLQQGQRPDTRSTFGDTPDGEVERPEITFDDVGGIHSVKEEVRRKIIHPLKHPEIFRAYGKKISGSLMLYGPPGCGKTHLARATAGEVDANFIAISVNEILDYYVGQCDDNLQELFELARSNRPCVLFLDQLDALANRRLQLQSGFGRRLINHFLAELDGMRASNDGVLILAATNAPWHLGAVFRRPGRFDRILFVAPPDQPARECILGLLLKNKPVNNINLTELAGKTVGFSGADLKTLVDEAIEKKLAAAVKSGHPAPLKQSDLLESLQLISPKTGHWLATARSYALAANPNGIYDDVLRYLER